MWTSEEEALAAADRDLLRLLARTALRDERVWYDRAEPVERWSAGLAKQVLEVSYVGLEAAGCALARVRFEPKEAGGAALRVRLADFVLAEEAADAPPPVVEGVELEEAARAALSDALAGRVRQDLGEGARIEGLVVGRAPPAPIDADADADAGPDDAADPPLLARCVAWRLLPRERIRLRYNAASGSFMGWRHEGWALPAAPPRDDLLDPEPLVDEVERSPLFPSGYALREASASTDAPHLLEALWSRSFCDLEVENDFAYAEVNLHTGRTAELSINESELDSGLRLSPEGADEALWQAFQQHFQFATRCGEVRRMYVEIPGQAVKPLAWVGQGMTRTGPVQIAVADRGAVLRVDET